MTKTLSVNGVDHAIDAPDNMPLLWVLRDLVGLKGTKFGCGIAQCGACTVMLDGQAQRSCVLPVVAAVGRQITTIEGVDSPQSKAVQAAWEELAVPQCGYCQSGQILAATDLLTRTPDPSPQDIDEHMGRNICRCCTYARIKKAVRLAADKLA